MPRYKLLCTSKNGIAVYVDPIGSHAATHFNDSPGLESLVITFLRDTVLTGEKEHLEHNFHKPIGKTDLVETISADSIIYAKRLNRDNYSRFVLNKQASDSSTITVVLYKKDDHYILYSAYVGLKVPSFPSSPTATAESIPFWKTHALVWGTQEVQPGTETSDWPWGS